MAAIHCSAFSPAREHPVGRAAPVAGKPHTCLLSASRTRESPKPNAENEGYNQRDPAQAHRDRERSNGDLGMVDQPQEMPNCKNAEENARDAQSSFW